MNKNPCVYLLASRRNGTLYVGVTSNLVKRIWEHKNNLVEGFTKRYSVHILVWYELHPTMESAISREKTIKEWKRRWKLDLIEQENPEWNDLYKNLISHLYFPYKGCECKSAGSRPCKALRPFCWSRSRVTWNREKIELKAAASSPWSLPRGWVATRVISSM